MRAHLVILTLLCVWGSTQAQQLSIDSLRHQLAIARHDTNRIQALWWLSFGYDAISFDSAQLYAHKALNLSRQIQNRQEESRALQRIAQSHWISGNYPQSLAEAFRSLQIAQELHFARGTVRSLNDIGNVYLSLGDNRKAINYFKQALKITNEAEKGRFASPLELNLAQSYQNENQLDLAWYYAQKSFTRTNRKGGLYTHYVHIGIGSLQFDRGHYRDAFNSLHKSVAINKAEKDYRLLAESYNELAQFFRKLNQPDSAIFYARATLQYAQQVGAKQTALKASTLLAELLDASDSREAVTYYRITKTLNDELYGVDKVLGLQRILVDEQQRLQAIELEREANRSKLRQFMLLAVLGVVLLVAFLLYRNNRQKHRANQLLDEQKAKVEKALKTLKTTQTQLIQREKMASLGELTAGIAHEIQNPLNFVNNFSEVSVELVDELDQELERGETREARVIAEDLRQNLQRITQNGQRASNIVKGMLEHSRTSSGERQPTNLNALADEYLNLAYQGARAKNQAFNCQLETHFDPDLPLISLVAGDMSRVLLNLFNNAFYAVGQKQKTAPADADYQPTVTVSTTMANGRVEIRVRDNGGGIPDAIREKIFQPFFTTKPTGEGTGLGLSLSYDIITNGHGGTLTVESVEGEGATFVVHLPIGYG